MDAFDQRPTQHDESGPAEATSIASAAPAVLPTMADLDRLSGQLDRVDATLAELDGPMRAVTN